MVGFLHPDFEIRTHPRDILTVLDRRAEDLELVAEPARVRVG
jgi:hypothetical protein